MMEYVQMGMNSQPKIDRFLLFPSLAFLLVPFLPDHRLTINAAITHSICYFVVSPSLCFYLRCCNYYYHLLLYHSYPLRLLVPTFTTCQKFSSYWWELTNVSFTYTDVQTARMIVYNNDKQRDPFTMIQNNKQFLFQ